MPVRLAVFRASRARKFFDHAAILATVSAVALCAATPAVHARSLGAATPTPSAPALAAAQAGSQEAARAASSSLKRATTAIQAMQAAQQAARDAAAAAPPAMPNAVPNGLRPGGLRIGSGVVGSDGSVNQNLWQGAGLPTEFIDGDRVKVTIDQKQQKAILTWDTFNVGGRTDLRFDQHGNRDWVALNRVLGTDAKPSQILGSIKADGSVYVINQNGIVFGGASQVNVGVLIASTAKITDAQFLNGIYSTPNGANWTPSFTDAAALLGNGNGGGVVKVEAGARIETHAPAAVTSSGGFVLLMGGQVVNAGSITTPNGQVQLAAGGDFVLRRGYATDGNFSSTTRGNEIAAGSWNGTTFTPGGAGLVRNEGMIFSPQGDITLAGRTIEQNGILVASTSVHTRGTIHLLNSATDTLGSITLGANSVTTVIPELESNEAALNSQRDALIAASANANQERASAATGAFDNLSVLADRLDQSRIEIVTGGNVTFKSGAMPEAGSLTIAQGGQVAVSAGGSILTESGATIDVSGVRDVVLAMSANNLMVNIQGNELRDSPQNRDSSYLKNASVWVDIRDLTFVPPGTGGYEGDRYYTPGGLLEIGGYLANSQHRIGEWVAVGGTITLAATQVNAQRGSHFDISGGSVRYDGGYIRTTNFLGPDGQTYNINNARADMTFYGVGQGFIRKHERWNVTEVWTSPFGRGRETVRWEDGYTVGRDAGRLILSTPTAIFEGNILADVVQGDRQFNARPGSIADGYKVAQNVVAQAGTLALGQYDARGLMGAYDTDVLIGDLTGLPIPSDRTNTAWFDAKHLSALELGGIDIATSGKITVDASLSVADGGSVRLVAATVDINADITARSGHIAATNHFTGVPNPGHLGLGTVTLAAGVTLDARGLWVNALGDRASYAKRAFVNAGEVHLVSSGDVTVSEGSLIDVSSGGGISAAGKFTGGRGGNVTLRADAVILNAGVGPGTGAGTLILDGEIRGFGFQGGGTLTVGAREIAVGAVAPTSATATYLSPDLLRTGFSHYNIVATSGLAVAPNTEVDLTTPVYRLSANAFATPTGANPLSAMEIWTPPLYLDNPVAGSFTQRAGADLSLVSLGTITLAAGSAIRVDDGQSVTINTREQITIEGTITAPSGTINIGNELGLEYLQTAGVAGKSIWIGDGAVLDVAARAVTGVDRQGRRYGSVRNGGTIHLGLSSLQPNIRNVLSAAQSIVIIRPGAVLDASGSHAVVDLVSGTGTEETVKAVDVASNGGSIMIGSFNGFYLEGRMRAASGGAGAAGGSLTLVLENAAVEVVGNAARAPRVLTIAQRAEGGLRADLTAGEADPAIPYGTGRISAEQVAAGGFDDLTLWSRDVLRFEGNVDLSLGRSLTLYRGMLNAATADTRVVLSAPYVLIDGAVDLTLPENLIYTGLLLGSYVAAPTNHGALRVEADLIDVRNRVWSGAKLSYQTALFSPSTPFQAAGFGTIELVSGGDIRFDTGFLASGGNRITLEAAQIYPLTGASAVIGAGILPTGPTADGVIIVRGNGSTPALPQSAFGNLGLVATTIDQGGILRAPLGKIALGERVATQTYFPQELTNTVLPSVTITLREGSITSTSAAGLVMPYGGTVDGQIYRYAGTQVAFSDIANGAASSGVTLKGQRIVAEPGSLLDLSGGGELTGAGFVSGRGGSVDVLRTPLVNANPANGYSAASNKVYAIIPNYAGKYAPASPDRGAGDPAIGQQITLSQPVGNLPAGTYTLLPSTYALLPGAWRIEIGSTTTHTGQTAALGNGSYVSTGTLGFANTGIRAAIPSRLVLTPADTVRTYSQYNETGYSEFARGNAALFGLLRPRLPVDGQLLRLDFKMGTGDVLSFDGDAKLAAAEDGFAGNVFVTLSTLMYGNPPLGTIEIRPSNAVPTPGTASLAAEDLSRLNAGSLLIGGLYSYYENISSGDLTGPRVRFYSATENSKVIVRDGADLRAGQIFLMASDEIVVESGAILDTTHSRAKVLDSTVGYLFGNWSVIGTISGLPDATARALLTVANGELNFVTPGVASTGRITVQDHAVLRTLGTIDFTASQGVNLDTDVKLNARYLSLSLPEINVGTEASLDAARTAGALGTGWTLTQSLLDRLLVSADPALPGVERLTLAATSSLNFFGDVTLDMRGSTGTNGRTLMLNTPAIYGWGASGDVALLSTDTLIWNGSLAGNGVLAAPYGASTPSAQRPGIGTGTLRIAAREIVFGYGPGEQYQNETTLDRLVLGFSTVDLLASERITANNRGTLSVYRSYDLGTHVYANGDLNLSTPLLTVQSGGNMAYIAGGAITARAPVTGPAGTAEVTALGGELRLKAGTVSIDTAVALPSGRLALVADGDITLTDRAHIDLSARSIAFFDVTKHSWGGDIDMRSTGGRIVQASGSVIDVSANQNKAGSIVVEALGVNGSVALDGTLHGDGAAGYEDGSFDLRTRTLADFTALNQRLNAGAFFQSRSMALKTGNLVVGDEIRARNVTLSVDGGSLTVVGTIDASGAGPGTIRLSARDDVTLASTAVLDAHGTVLQVDGNGQAIEAKNRGQIELTSSQGWVRLAPGATIDLSAPDGVARGRIEINARRLGGVGGDGAGANDIAVDAAGALSIRGAASIAVNGFRRYELPDGGVIDQNLFDTLHGDSTGFVNAALANAGLQARLAGLRNNGAFHLRPGVEIWSEGDLATQGDIDFSGYRYGPQADPALRGSGEPGVVWVRAAGGLNVNGSITDGFGQPLASPDDVGWILPTGIALPTDVTLAADIVLPGVASGPVTGTTTIVNSPGLVLDFDIPVRVVTLKAGVVIPLEVPLHAPASLPAGFVLKGDIVLPNGTVLTAGTTLTANTTIPTGSIIKPGNVMPTAITAPAMTWPAGTPLNIINSASIVLAAPVTVRAGATVPAGLNIPRISRTLTANTVISQPMVLAGGAGASSFPTAGVTLPFSISITATSTLKRGVTLPFAFTTATGTSVALPAGWVPSARILNADGTVAFAANQPVPAGSRLAPNMRIEAGMILPTGGIVRTAAGVVIPGGTLLSTYFTGTLTLNTPVVVAAGTTLPSGSVLQSLVGAEVRSRGSDGTMGRSDAIAPMLAPGMQSWSMRYVSGADLGAADTRSVGTAGAGDLVLSDPHYHFGGSTQVQEAISVLRTGTGYLDLLAGGDYRQKSLFGVYTAGTQTGSVARAPGAIGDPFAAALPAAKLYFTDGGGDVLVAARGNVQGYAAPIDGPSGTATTSSATANWLVQDGSQWGINFGTYEGSQNVMRGFASIGSVGGNVVVKSGGDAPGLTAAIGSSGQAQGGGIRILGGGDLTVDIAGQLSSASLADMRGDLDLRAAAVGTVVAQQFGLRQYDDPRAPDPSVSYGSQFFNPSSLTIGDGTLSAFSRSELVASASGVNGLNTAATRAILFSAGGDVGLEFSDAHSLSAISAAGDILLSNYGSLAPSPYGQLELLAWNTINGRGNLQTTGSPYWTLGAGDLTSNLHINDPEPVRLYAVKGDILNVSLGISVLDVKTFVGKQTWVLAGRDIVGLDAFILNNRATDVSRLSAGRDIIYSNVEIAGPGALEVAAGRNLYQADKAMLVSTGPLVRGDTRPGADIAVMVGMGSGTPGVGSVAWTDFANLYLDFAHLADPGRPLAEQPGKVARTYEKALVRWLADRYGFGGDERTALAYFMALSPEQQRIFLRQVYFAEMLESGREYNNPDSTRYGSYLRGRNAIAALFPENDAAGNPIERHGDLVLFQGTANNASIRTLIGGSLQLLVPDGQITVGIAGVTPVEEIYGQRKAPAGLLTQGSGDIQMYSKGSILVGLSRIMTTFGGDIFAWSAEGDINAGRGAKTTIVYTPSRRVYDAYGNVALSPNVPSSGAGIATLNPIPGIAAGDVDLIAPLGTIDAGEAGIRSSGNVNLAALQIINAANIQAQGTTTGVPTIQAPNVAGLTEASNTAGAAAQQAAAPVPNSAAAQASIIIVEVLGYGGGDTPENSEEERRRKSPGRQSYDPNSAVQLVGNGSLTERRREMLTEEELGKLDQLVGQRNPR